MILAFILDNQLDNARTANSILPEFHLSDNTLFTRTTKRHIYMASDKTTVT